MISNKIYNFILILTFFSFQSYSQTNGMSINEFAETNPPKVWSKEWQPLNNSKNTFGVEIKNGKLEIKRVNPTYDSEFDLPNGKLIGINGGEFGGKLSYVPSDKSKEEIEIKETNAKYIFSFKGKIYFLEGLAHMDWSVGGLFELTINDDKFTYNEIVDLEDSPEAFTIFEDTILIATHKNFYIIKDNKKELVFKNTFWESLYPNSIAALDPKNVFIGMRGGIVKIDLTIKTLKFYRYKNL